MSPDLLNASESFYAQTEVKSDLIEATLAERGARYGTFKDHASIAQGLKGLMRQTPNWEILTPSQKESLEMQAHKIARILNGDPNYDDSWVDIAGYSKLVADELQGKVS